MRNVMMITFKIMMDVARIAKLKPRKVFTVKI